MLLIQAMGEGVLMGSASLMAAQRDLQKTRIFGASFPPLWGKMFHKGAPMAEKSVLLNKTNKETNNSGFF